MFSRDFHRVCDKLYVDRKSSKDSSVVSPHPLTWYLRCSCPIPPPFAERRKSTGTSISYSSCPSRPGARLRLDTGLSSDDPQGRVASGVRVDCPHREVDRKAPSKMESTLKRVEVVSGFRRLSSRSVTQGGVECLVCKCVARLGALSEPLRPPGVAPWWAGPDTGSLVEWSCTGLYLRRKRCLHHFCNRRRRGCNR